MSAGVYAARKKLKTLFITDSFGGQSVVSLGVENWIGTIKISGPELARALEEHLRAYAGDVVTIKDGVKVDRVERDGDNFKTKVGAEEFLSRAVLITTGSSRRKLDVPGAKEFENKGITYCASCDGPLFADMDVVVIGGGNAGFETAAQLLAYAKSVTLLTHGKFKADAKTIEMVLKDPKMKAIENVELKEIKGEKFVKSVVFEVNGKMEELAVSGVFAEIGLIPTTDYVKDLLPLNKFGQIKIDPRTQRTEVKGVWAAGDATDVLYHQNNIASGDAVRALEDIYLALRTEN